MSSDLIGVPEGADTSLAALHPSFLDFCRLSDAAVVKPSMTCGCSCSLRRSRGSGRSWDRSNHGNTLLVPIPPGRLLTWLTEWTVWNKSSVLTVSLLKWMVLLPLFCFKIPRLTELVLFNKGWPVSLNRCTILLTVQFHGPFLIVRIVISFLFRPWTQKRPVSLQEFHRVILDFFCVRDTNSHHSFFLTNQCHWTLTWRWSSP